MLAGSRDLSSNMRSAFSSVSLVLQVQIVNIGCCCYFWMACYADFAVAEDFFFFSEESSQLRLWISNVDALINHC